MVLKKGAFPVLYAGESKQRSFSQIEGIRCPSAVQMVVDAEGSLGVHVDCFGWKGPMPKVGNKASKNDPIAVYRAALLVEAMTDVGADDMEHALIVALSIEDASNKVRLSRMRAGVADAVGGADMMNDILTKVPSDLFDLLSVLDQYDIYWSRGRVSREVSRGCVEYNERLEGLGVLHPKSIKQRYDQWVKYFEKLTGSGVICAQESELRPRVEDGLRWAIEQGADTPALAVSAAFAKALTDACLLLVDIEGCGGILPLTASNGIGGSVVGSAYAEKFVPLDGITGTQLHHATRAFLKKNS